MYSSRIAFLALLFASSGAHAETFACDNSSVRVFADGATLNEPPVRILTGPATGFNECYSLALDSDNRELWVSGSDVHVFPIGAQGNVAPIRSIAVGSQGLGFAVALAVDVAANEVMIGTVDGRIHAFPRLATGGSPIRTILGAGAGVQTIIGLVIDRARDEVFVSSLGSPSKLAVFSRTASGAAMQVEPQLLLAAPGEIEIDAGHDELYVVSGASIIVTQVTTPLRTFQAGFVQKPWGLALRANGDLLVGDQTPTHPDPIKHFGAQPIGSVPPVDFIINGSSPDRAIWGLATTRQSACNNANTARCLFRDGLEQPLN